MLGDPYMTDYKWREILPICKMVDEECRHYVSWNQNMGHLAELVLKIIDPDREEIAIG